MLNAYGHGGCPRTDERLQCPSGAAGLMRNIILPGKVRRENRSRIRRSEKESIEARDRRILEFPRTMSPREVAKAGEPAPAGVLLQTMVEKHACKGKNSCRGQGGYQSGDQGCKGRNACKGKGGCATNKK
jgi:hypothetical protein